MGFWWFVVGGFGAMVVTYLLIIRYMRGHEGVQPGYAGLVMRGDFHGVRPRGVLCPSAGGSRHAEQTTTRNVLGWPGGFVACLGCGYGLSAAIERNGCHGPWTQPDVQVAEWARGAYGCVSHFVHRQRRSCPGIFIRDVGYVAYGNGARALAGKRAGGYR
jgi:hypothetical protein